jgi:hypothetical protein
VSPAVNPDGRFEAARLDVGVSAGEPSVGGGDLHGLDGGGIGAEGMDLDARHEGHDVARTGELRGRKG